MLREELKIEKAEAYLSEVENLNQERKRKESERRVYRGVMESPRIQDYLFDRKESSPEGDSVGKAVIRYLEMVAEIDEVIEKLSATHKQISKMIDEMECPDEKEILHKRFIDYERYNTWQSIIDSSFWSERQVYRVRKRALLSFYEIMEKYNVQ